MRLNFLIAGQSNAVGHGDLEGYLKLYDPKVFRVVENKETVAEEPLQNAVPQGKGGGFALPFAIALREMLPALEIGLIPTASNGSAIIDWLPGAKLFNYALELIGANSVDAIIWYQGETDACTEATAQIYDANLEKTLTGFRTALNQDALPVIAVGIGDYLPKSVPFRNMVASKTRDVVDKIGNAVFVSTNGLTHNPGDELHLDTRSQRTLAKRLAAAFVKNFSLEVRAKV